MRAAKLAGATLAVAAIMLGNVSVTMAQSRPVGTFKKTCKNCSVGNNGLTCDCRDKTGISRTSTIYYEVCAKHSVANNDGKLVCGR